MKKEINKIRPWIVIIWLVYVGLLLVGAEAIARYKLNYLMLPLRLRQKAYSEIDKVRIWNENFVAARKELFKGWSTPIKTFPAESDVPRYLFKPDMKMAKCGTKLVPAQPGDKIKWSSNSWGFRGQEISIEKPKGITRIVALGASTTEGSQSDDQTYPVYLEQILQEKGYHVEVINAGHHGYVIADLVALFRERVLPLKPDIIIFYEAANNINCGEWLIDFWTGQYSWGAGHGQWFQVLQQYSALFNLVIKALKFDTRQPPPLPHSVSLDFPKATLTNYQENIKKLIEISREHRVLPILATFITVANKEVLLDYEDNPSLWQDLYLKWYPFIPEEIELIYDYYNQALKDIATKEDTPLIDLASQYPKDTRYFKDHVHFTAEGNQLLASYIANFLTQEIFNKVE